MNQVKKSSMWTYITLTYLFFWVVIMLIGGAIFVFDAPKAVVKGMMLFSSWSPTIILIAMFKKVLPGKTLKSFFAEKLKIKISWKILLYSMLIITGIFMLSVVFLSLIEKTALSDQIAFVASVLIGNILFTAFQGASGEESGWRGYLLPEMESKYGFIRGNIILGLVWGFWHLPLWFVSTEYQGIQLLLYIVSFMIGIVSFSMIIGIFMKKTNSLFLAFWMHFFFNFVLTFFIGKDYLLLSALAVLYLLTAIVLVYIKKRNLVTSQDTSTTR